MGLTEAIAAAESGPRSIRVLTPQDGDKVVATWDPTDPVSVLAARQAFETERGSKAAFEVAGSKVKTARAFDPQAAGYIFAVPMVGG